MNELSGRNWRVLVGHVLNGLRTLADNSVQLVCTSTPYWGLRSYSTQPQIWGGVANCAHSFGEPIRAPWANSVSGPGSVGKNDDYWKQDGKTSGTICENCGAWRGELGNEPTPERFTENIVSVFREVFRVLRDDGVCFLNIGDTYATGAGKANNPGSDANRMSHMGKQSYVEGFPTEQPNRMPIPGLKAKDLCGIPWRLASALQADGWYLRSEIIWHKPSPMPESVTDRPTKAHEQIFLLAKSERYFWDQEAVKEPATGGSPGNKTHKGKTAYEAGEKRHRTTAGLCEMEAVENRNIRTVWELGWTSEDVVNLIEYMNAKPPQGDVWKISSQSFKGAHFATFPRELPRRCITAGTSDKGACVECGTPWRRIVEKDRVATRPGIDSKVNRASDDPDSPYEQHSGMIVGNRDPKRHMTVTSTVGWEPGCQCGCLETVPCVVLDPFSGSGTTGMVATEMGRIYIGTELNPDYAEMSRTRIESWKKRDAVKAIPSTVGQRPLFE